MSPFIIDPHDDDGDDGPRQPERVSAPMNIPSTNSGTNGVINSINNNNNHSGDRNGTDIGDSSIEGTHNSTHNSNGDGDDDGDVPPNADQGSCCSSAHHGGCRCRCAHCACTGKRPDNNENRNNYNSQGGGQTERVLDGVPAELGQFPSCSSQDSFWGRNYGSFPNSWEVQPRPRSTDNMFDDFEEEDDDVAPSQILRFVGHRFADDGNDDDDGTMSFRRASSPCIAGMDVSGMEFGVDPMNSSTASLLMDYHDAFVSAGPRATHTFLSLTPECRHSRRSY